MKFLVFLFVAAVGFLPSAAGAGSGCVTDNCHAKLLDFKFVHGPAAVQDCAFCHEKVGDHKFRLVAKGPALCDICHEEDLKKVGKKAGDCLKCHNPHGTDIEFHLKPGAGKKCAK
jgi:predicted CXXCH cytochrome family protein